MNTSHSPRRLWALVAAMALLLSACASTGRSAMPDLTTDARVDLDAFMGEWFVTAHIPYWPERGKVRSRDIYSLRADGRIDNVFAFQPDFDQPEKRWNGVSEVVPGSNGAHWRVQFIWPFKADLLVLEVDPDYQWALLGHPKRRMAWIFSRSDDMGAGQYAELRQRFADHGYDPEDLVRVPQRPGHRGQPGFAEY